jgi:hypothetical protein
MKPNIPMNIDKVNLIVKNMELLVRSLKEELKDSNIVKLQDLIVSQQIIDDDPDYYEEED